MMMGSRINGRVPYHVAVYLVDDILVDTGSHNKRRDLADYLSGRDVSVAVNTHHHLDHIGANKLLMERLKIPIFAPSLSVPIIAERQSIFPYQEGLWGCPEPCLVNPLSCTVNTKNCALKVLHTSGHSPDHAVFFLKERSWLFTGDEFITEKPNAARKNENIRQMLRVLRTLLDLAPESLMTSSGMIYRNGTAVLSRAIEYIGEMRERVRTMKNDGLSAEEMVVKLFGRETPLKTFTGGQFSRENFVQGFLK